MFDPAGGKEVYGPEVGLRVGVNGPYRMHARGRESSLFKEVSAGGVISRLSGANMTGGDQVQATGIDSAFSSSSPDTGPSAGVAKSEQYLAVIKALKFRLPSGHNRQSALACVQDIHKFNAAFISFGGQFTLAGMGIKGAGRSG